MIIMNTLTGAVSEYTNHAFDSITDTQAGSASGLYAFGGNTDNGTEIVAEIVTGKPLWDSSLKKRLESVYFSMKGEGAGELIVQGENDEWRYRFPIRASGLSRALAGKGIRENYLAFGFSNPDGDPFSLDRIEVRVMPSTTRRV